jgi:hypothetical protein
MLKTLFYNSTGADPGDPSSRHERRTNRFPFFRSATETRETVNLLLRNTVTGNPVQRAMNSREADCLIPTEQCKKITGTFRPYSM